MQPIDTVTHRYHMLTLADEFFDNLQRDHYEYGGWGIDSKRPFGNSDVEGDILEILEQKPEGDDGEDQCWSSKQRQYAASLYDELGTFLQAEWIRMRNLE